MINFVVFCIGKLALGVSMEKVLDEIRDSADGSLKRVHLITRQDLQNVLRDFQLNKRERLHQNDVISVNLWVQKMLELKDECPVLYYKPQGTDDQENALETNDFMLVIMTSGQRELLVKFGENIVCIDTTHGTNVYDFHLTTLMVVDEFGSGLPISYCISNRIHKEAMAVFFSKIKSRVGNINSKVFMTDDAPAYGNAWTEVNGEVPMQLLCTWHVDRNWRQNLSKISGNKEKQALVYKTMRVILEESDSNKFSLLMQKFLEECRNDPDTKAFGEYFEIRYAHRPHAWAYCYRKDAGVNTNMYLEALHKVLKHLF